MAYLQTRSNSCPEPENFCMRQTSAQLYTALQSRSKKFGRRLLRVRHRTGEEEAGEMETAAPSCHHLA